MIIDKQIIRDWDVYYEDDIELIETSELNHWYEETLGYQPYRLYEYLTNQYQDINILDIGTEYGFSAVSFAKNRSNKVDTWDLHRYSTFEILRHRYDNITPYTSDVSVGLGKYHPEHYKFVLIDVDPHDGVQELELYNILKESYKGFVLLDDIKLNTDMFNFWNNIEEEKYDLSDIGHETGTGLVNLSDEEVRII